jgi:hypothetical protein
MPFDFFLLALELGVALLYIGGQPLFGILAAEAALRIPDPGSAAIG